MGRSRRIAFSAVAGLSLVALVNSPLAGAQNSGKGRLIDSYRETAGVQRPAWAADATERGLKHFEAKGKARDSFQLRGVDRDDLGTHVRLDQTHRGVPVFGGQVLAHLDNQGNVVADGGDFYAVNIDTKAKINGQQAIKSAETALGYTGQFVDQPKARLVVLPRDGGAVLAYQVGLHIEDGTDATADHQYFINAQDGSVVTSYNDLDTQDRTGAPRIMAAATGSGKSLYSGTVSIGTDLVSGAYYMRDLNRGGMQTVDMNNRTSGSGTVFSDADNVWGTSTSASRQSAGVDAHYGSALTWDYFLNSFGRRGIDGNGFKVISRVHYGRAYNNAFWNGVNMTYGDGDGVQFTPLTSIDVAGHEITHGLTEKTAGLIYSNESGALNESFSDIFGSMVEFTRAVGGNYEIGEEIYTPGTAGDALRSMSNPALYGDPDHYSKRYVGTGDNGGVHINSGIQNQAFYLLATGATNRTSGLSVTAIGRDKAAAIFYRALTVYLGPSSNFAAARTATLRSATDLYGAGSAEYNATAQAWTAVGVQ